MQPGPDQIPAWTDHYFLRTKKAIERFGDKDVTYAVFMRRPVVSAPRLAVDWLNEIAATRNTRFDIDLRFPEGKWVGAGVPIIPVAFDWAHRVLLVGPPLTPGEDNRLLDYLPDQYSPGPEDEAYEHALRDSIDEALGTLKEREAKILRLYFGLDDQEFVVAFESDKPEHFLDLVMELRHAEASNYTLRDTPIFTCIHRELPEMLDTLGG